MPFSRVPLRETYKSPQSSHGPKPCARQAGRPRPNVAGALRRTPKGEWPGPAAHVPAGYPPHAANGASAAVGPELRINSAHAAWHELDSATCLTYGKAVRRTADSLQKCSPLTERLILPSVRHCADGDRDARLFRDARGGQDAPRSLPAFQATRGGTT